jgi:hypothetical protein
VRLDFEALAVSLKAGVLVGLGLLGVSLRAFGLAVETVYFLPVDKSLKLSERR